MMKKGDKEMKVWGLIVILSRFGRRDLKGR